VRDAEHEGTLAGEKAPSDLVERVALRAGCDEIAVDGSVVTLERRKMAGMTPRGALTSCPSTA
jgi:hypothetical protein